MYACNNLRESEELCKPVFAVSHCQVAAYLRKPVLIPHQQAWASVMRVAGKLGRSLECAGPEAGRRACGKLPPGWLGSLMQQDPATGSVLPRPAARTQPFISCC